MTGRLNRILTGKTSSPVVAENTLCHVMDFWPISTWNKLKQLNNFRYPPLFWDRLSVRDGSAKILQPLKTPKILYLNNNDNYYNENCSLSSLKSPRRLWNLKEERSPAGWHEYTIWYRSNFLRSSNWLMRSILLLGYFARSLISFSNHGAATLK